MKYILVLFLSLFCCIVTIHAQNYEPQGTTVKKMGCDVMLIIQIALENDSTGDIAKIQAALDGCFSLTCDLPCADGKTGKCKIITKAIVIAWNSLSAADKPKFHHIKMLSGQGVSSVDAVGVPNSGKSSGGSWYRDEYDPKVYCHETMHLAGLDDHYRDCRPNRIALGVDNCKDGDTCTAAQKARGACPSCHGYEDDVMGSDVTKPIDCNRDIVEVIRLANNPLNPSFICSDSCCEVHRTNVLEPHFGLIVDGGLGYYHMKDEMTAGDKLSLYGINISIGANATLPINEKVNLIGFVKFNYASTSTNNTTTQNSGSNVIINVNHYTYHFSDISVGINAGLKFSNTLSAYMGPEIAAIISARSRANGTTTYNNITTSYGDNNFRNIETKKKMQLGVNLGLMREMEIQRRLIEPYLNIHVPLTNEIAFPSVKNKLYEFNVGALVLLK